MTVSTPTSPHGVPFVTGTATAPAYWALGALWIVLVDSEQTGGAFSVMEQRMPAGGGPGPHVHPIDEWFNVLEGTITFRLDGDEVQGGPGDSIWIPRGTVHQFHTETAAHVLNGYTPGGFEQIVVGLGTPALSRELPPEQDRPTPQMFERFTNNFWSASADSGWARRWTFPVMASTQDQQAPRTPAPGT